MTEPASGRGPVTVVNALLAANLAVFFLWIWPAVPLPVMVEHFLVSWVHLAEGRVWVLLTAVFSHNLLLHLLINMIVLTSFGPPLERVMGAGRFLLFFLVAGVVGSLAHAAASHFLIGRPDQPALGASSALAGMLLLYALSFPKAKILLLFIIPLPAIVAALAFVAIDIWGLIVQIEGGGLPIGHGAHLGGALVGILYYVVRGRDLRKRGGRSPP
jgi:membrane associated rhomboid family serine protease